MEDSKKILFVKQDDRIKILFVEDDEILASGLIYTFECEGYEVLYCKDYESAIHSLKDAIFSLAILDLSLPDGSGFELLREIKKRFNIPVIFLTALDDEANTVKGLELGADDYIAKPFRLYELIARIKAALRRSNVTSQEDIIRICGIEIKIKQAKVYRASREIFLTALEYRLLLMLAKNRGQILTRDQILAELWDENGNFVNDNTLTVHIKRLREKLSDDPQNPQIIQTVRGIGYRAGIEE